MKPRLSLFTASEGCAHVSACFLLKWQVSAFTQMHSGYFIHRQNAHYDIFILFLLSKVPMEMEMFRLLVLQVVYLRKCVGLSRHKCFQCKAEGMCCDKLNM